MTIVHLSIMNDAAIVVGDVRVTPAATHLFALLLVLALSTDRPRTRAELQALLFGDEVDPRVASHNLRQLLYRVRALGVEMEGRATGESLTSNSAESPLARLQHSSLFERAAISSQELRILPGYQPALTSRFRSWLDAARDQIETDLRARLMADLRCLRGSLDWKRTAALARTLQQIDPWSEELIEARVEALAMLGRKAEALDALDEFMRASENDGEIIASARKLRARVARTPLPQHQTTLRGRGDCLTYLASEWVASRVGGARMCTILGAAGQGKTRIVADFSAKTALARGLVIQHRCDPLSRDYPLSLFSNILPTLRSLRGSLGASPEFKSALDRLKPSHSDSSQDLPEGASIEALRAEIQLGLIDLLEAVSGEHQLLLVVDDAHWLDEASCAALRAIATSANSAIVLIIACARPREGALSFLGIGGRSSSHKLAPLTDADIRSIIREVSADDALLEDDVSWGVEQAAGNPSYAQMMGAQSGHSLIERRTPFDLKALAANAYFSLETNSKLVLDACLILGRFASLTLLQATLNEQQPNLLSALRDLESRDLIAYSHGVISVPHSLVREALETLIPSSVAGLLSSTVARLLEAELAIRPFDPAIARVAARCWARAGNSDAALALALKCAREAAIVGEPSAATEVLIEFMAAPLSNAHHTELLEHLAKYAKACGRRDVVATALRAQLRIASVEGRSQAERQTLELEIIEADLLNGGLWPCAMPALLALASDMNVDSDVRVRASIRLLIGADLTLDTMLADCTIQLLSEIPACGASDHSRLRAELVYHTTFGDPNEAGRIALALLQQFSTPDLGPIPLEFRSHSAFALVRLRDLEVAHAVLENDFAFMSSHGVKSAAIYCASQLAEVGLLKGSLTDAKLWLKRASLLAGDGTPSQIAPTSAFYSSAGCIAMVEGQFDEAERYFDMPLNSNYVMASPRMQAERLAFSLRLRVLQSTDEDFDAAITELNVLYRRGCRLGGQDMIVEALWCAEVARGRLTAANQLLREYLGGHRREIGIPDWSLRHSTSADQAWRPEPQLL